jgi:hypothetical protein
MYKPASTHIFPHLVFLDEISLKSESDKTTKLYKLDWDDFDSAVLKRHIDWNAKCWPDSSIPIIQKFDEYYEGILQSLRFAIPFSYLNEIRRVTQCAMIEWSIHRSFDTDIREMCLKPAIRYIETAFKLICDCAYDTGTKYYYRADNKYILAPMLLYRFWQHQTGSGRITDHAGFDSLKSRLAWAITVSTSDTSQTISAEGIERSKLEAEALKKFLNYFEDRSNKIQESFDNSIKIEVCGSASPGAVIQGPSIEATEVEKRIYKFI